MKLTDVPQKTPLGTDEIVSRAHALSQRARSLLILVDGKRSVTELMTMAKSIENSEILLQDLYNKNLIAFEKTVASSVIEKINSSEASFGFSEKLLALTEENKKQLATNNLINFRETVKYVGDRIVDGLGIRSYKFILKLQHCSTMLEVVLLLHDYETRLKIAMGDTAAQKLIDYVQDQLHLSQLG